MTLDEQVQLLKDRQAAATRARVRAEHERDAAAARLAEITEQLRRDFDVNNAEQAKALLADLHAELRAAITDAGTALDQAGAS